MDPPESGNIAQRNGVCEEKACRELTCAEVTWAVGWRPQSAGLRVEGWT
jgi:hypothetical protein